MTRIRPRIGLVAAAAALALLFAGVAVRGALEAEALETDQQDFAISIAAHGQRVSLPYSRQLEQYDATAGWLNGERAGYYCAYTFLEHEGVVVGRVTFWVMDDIPAGQVEINDRFMLEGRRYYDGREDPTNDTPQDIRELGDCTWRFRNTGIPPDDPEVGPLPVITFKAASDGHVLEVRDYNTVQQAADGRFGSGPVPYEFQIVAHGHGEECRRTDQNGVEVAGDVLECVQVNFYQGGHVSAIALYHAISPLVDLESNFLDETPSPSPTTPPPPVLECFAGELASEVDGHLEAFRVCTV